MTTLARRSLNLLKTLFPGAALQLAEPLKDSGGPLDVRFEAYGVAQQIEGFLVKHPEVACITLEPKYSQNYRSDTDTYVPVVKLKAIFAFEVPVSMGCVFACATSSSEIVEAECARLLSLVGGPNQQERRSEIEAVSRRCLEAMESFGKSGYRNLLETDKHAFWERGDLTVQRKDYLESRVGDELDVDALCARIGKTDKDIIAQQEDLRYPPAFWNSATVKTIPARLKAGMPIAACDSNGVSPLVAAIICAKEDVVAKLLSAGADPNTADATGHSGVTAAVAVENPPLIKQLIERGGDPNGVPMMPSLLVALATGRPNDMVSVLLGQGADAEAVMPDGRPFNQPLERLLSHLGKDSFGRRQITEVVLSHATEMAVRNSIDNASIGSQGKRPKISLAL